MWSEPSLILVEHHLQFLGSSFQAILTTNGELTALFQSINEVGKQHFQCALQCYFAPCRTPSLEMYCVLLLRLLHLHHYALIVAFLCYSDSFLWLLLCCSMLAQCYVVGKLVKVNECSYYIVMI